MIIKCPICGLDGETDEVVTYGRKLRCPHCEKPFYYKGSPKTEPTMPQAVASPEETDDASKLFDHLMASPEETDGAAEYFDQPFFVATPASVWVENLINWDVVLGWRIRPKDVARQIADENGKLVPYSSDLKVKIAKIAMLVSERGSDPLTSNQTLKEWFFDTFVHLIRKSKMRGI